MTLEDEFMVRVTNAQGGLSKNDERIIDHLRERLHELAFHTSASLASEVGVSRAAVVRASRKLGYQGFLELRNVARAEARATSESPLTRFTSAKGASAPASSLEVKFHQDEQNLASTVSLVRDTLATVAGEISRADDVYVVGNRKSFAFAMYFQRLLMGLRPGVQLVDPGYPDELARASSNAVVIGLLFRRYSRLSLTLLRQARQRGAKIVVITDGAAHSFLTVADHVLASSTESPSLFQSMVAPVALLEVLAGQIAELNPTVTRASLERAEEFARAQKLLLGKS